jgi:hypothetical protein
MNCPSCSKKVAGVYEAGSYSCSGCGGQIQVNPAKKNPETTASQMVREMREAKKLKPYKKSKKKNPDYRKFNGELYELILSGLSKDEANRQAVSQRKGGRKARVLKGGPGGRSGKGYALWVGTGAIGWANPANPDSPGWKQTGPNDWTQWAPTEPIPGILDPETGQPGFGVKKWGRLWYLIDLSTDAQIDMPQKTKRALIERAHERAEGFFGPNWRGNPASNPGYPVRSLSDVKGRNKAIGHHFFDRGNAPVVGAIRRGRYLITKGDAYHRGWEKEPSYRVWTIHEDGRIGPTNSRDWWGEEKRGRWPVGRTFGSVQEATRAIHKIDDENLGLNPVGNPSSNPSSQELFDSIVFGSKVTIENRHGQKQTGTAIIYNKPGMLADGSEGSWALNMGGKYGRPGRATPSNVVSVPKKRGGKRTLGTMRLSGDYRNPPFAEHKLEAKEKHWALED